GTFTGSTIPDSSAVKPALQALETAGEQTASDVAALASTAPGEGAELVGFSAPYTGASPLTVNEALLAGLHTFNVWYYMTPAMRADALAGTKLLDHSPAFQ